MKLRHKYLVVLALFGTAYLSAQDKYFIGLRMGPSYEEMLHEDPGGEIISPWVYYNFNYSINLGMKIWRSIWIESGMTYNNTGEGFGISESGVSIIRDSYISGQIPILISGRTGMLNDRIGVCVKGGMVLNIPAYSPSGQAGGFVQWGLGVDGRESIHVKHKTEYDWSGLNTLLQIGGEICYVMGHWAIGIGMNYTYGWKDITIMELSYERTGREEQEARVYGRGTQLNYFVLCEYRFGDEQ